MDYISLTDIKNSTIIINATPFLVSLAAICINATKDDTKYSCKRVQATHNVCGTFFLIWSGTANASLDVHQLLRLGHIIIAVVTGMQCLQFHINQVQPIIG